MFEELTAADGHGFACWMEHTSGVSKGGIVILQEIFGVTDQLKGVAGRYAKMGYDVAIPALFDRQERDAVIAFDDGPRGRDLMLAANPDEVMLDVGAAVDALAVHGAKVGVIGFCWGGGLAIRTAQMLPVAGAVAFYGTRLSDYLGAPLKAPVLGHFGETDGHVPPELLAQAHAALPEMEVHLYEAGHAFANDARPADYVTDAAEAAHGRTAEFLARVLG